MTIKTTPGARIRRVFAVLALVDVLGFTPANAAVTTMSLHSLNGESRGGTTCGADHAAGFRGPAVVDVPPIARLQRVTGETGVRVDLSARGALINSAVYRSSGNPWLDRAAIAAARSLRYTPEVAGCAPIAGSYALDVRFDAD